MADATAWLQQLNLRIQEFWVDDFWDEEKLTGLVGSSRTNEIMQLAVWHNFGSYVFIWKPTPNGTFTMASTWEVMRVKGNKHEWMKCVSQNAPKKHIALYVEDIV